MGPTLKNCLFPIICITKKKWSGQPVKLFFTLFKLNITFYFKCYIRHKCCVNLNWDNTQLYSSAKPLHNVPNSVLSFANFCFPPWKKKKWKKNWFCYVNRWKGKKEMSAKISKCLSRNLFIGVAAKIRAVYKDYEILVTLKRCISLSLSF